MAHDERRKNLRRLMSLPVRVQGHDPDGTAWEEMTSSLESSSGGIGFRIRRPVAHGQVLQLSLPLPKTLRKYDLGETAYHVYALVRSVATLPEGAQRVGVRFLGRTPPEGYAANPGRRYLLPGDPPPRPADRRRHPRFPALVDLRLFRIEAREGEGTEETTVAENLSRSGALVLTSLPIGRGETLRVSDTGGSFASRAEVRSVRIGRDGVPRLSLRFLEAEVPDDLLRKE